MKAKSPASAVAFPAIFLLGVLLLVTALFASALGSFVPAIYIIAIIGPPCLPFLLVNFYWVYHLFGHPRQLHASHYRAMLFSSVLFSISLAPYFVALLALRADRILTATVALVAFALAQIAAALVLSRSYATILEGPTPASPPHPEQLALPKLASRRIRHLGLVAAVLLWSALFLFFRGHFAFAAALLVASMLPCGFVLLEMIRLAKGSAR